MEFKTKISLKCQNQKLKNSSSQRLNGFKFWQVKRDDKFILLDDVRQNFREKIIA